MGARIYSHLISHLIVGFAAAAAFSPICIAQVNTNPIAAAGVAEESAQMVDQVENARFKFIGQIHTESAHVRSGPGENHYPTLRLSKGAEVTVVGMKFDWLKILPPEGSYSAISKDFVRLAPGSRTGTVTATNVRVRAAGNVSSLKSVVQCLLNNGDEVEVLGEEEGYYQIRTPAEAYVFINQKFVTPIRQLNVDPIAGRQRQPQQPEGTFESRPPLQEEAVARGPTTQPAESTAQRPTTQPVRWDLARIETEFERLEGLNRELAAKRLDEQPIRELIAGYELLSAQQNLPLAMRQVSHVRLLTLQARLKSQEEYLATQRMQEEGEKKLAQLRAEREAVEQRMAGNVTVFTAVGTLQASTLQAGAGTLYRLTDPSTGRTLCYVRGTRDPRFVTFVDKFVGVKGEITNDPQLSMRVIPATEIAAVDPQKVNKNIVAQIMPPSLLANGGRK